jgi:NAD(P)-dependent dehydrogenase (short-subunit alcohol dehydrogenase family)
MIVDLVGKRAIVTGSTAGIGFAIASGLAEAGSAVVVNGRSQRSVDAAKARLAEKFAQAVVAGVAADLATSAGVADFLNRSGDADILVNNLGIFEPKSFSEITDDDWHRFFDTNVLSGIRLSRHFLPAMLRRNWGRIVFISSESALNIPVEMIHYGMTKTAQLAVSRGLAESVAGSGVTVNAVLPGPTRSEGVADFFAQLAREQGISQDEMEKQFIAQHRPTSLLRRLATVEDGKHGRVCLLTAGIGHEWRSAPRRRRGGSVDRLRPALQLPSAGAPISGTSQTFYRYQPKICWPLPSGTPSAGELARKESSRLVLLPSGFGSPMDHHSGSGTKASNIYLGTRLGLSANTGCRERRNTISPTCRRRLACVPWPPPSKRAGFVSRRISS